MKKIIMLLLMVSAFCAYTGEEKLNELSGVLKKTVKAHSKYRLELDGYTGSFYLRGKILEEIPEGTRIRVKGNIKTELLKARKGSPFFTHWMIFMQVKEYKIIKKPFEELLKSE